MIPTRAITLHVYYPMIQDLDEAIKKSSRFGKVSNITKSRWINEAITQKLAKPPTGEELEDSFKNRGKHFLRQFLIAVPADVSEKMDAAVRESGLSRNKWVNAAIRKALGLPEGKPVEDGTGVRIQMGVYISNARLIDERAEMEGITRTAWINAAIRERLEREKDLPAPVFTDAPKVQSHAQIEAAARRAKMEEIRAERAAQAAKAQQMEGVPVAKLAEDEELSEFDWG